MKNSQKLVVLSAVLVLALAACSTKTDTSSNKTVPTSDTSMTTSASAAEYAKTANDEASNIQVAATIIPDIEFALNTDKKDPTEIAKTITEEKANIEASLANIKKLTAPTDNTQIVDEVNAFVKDADAYLKILNDLLPALTAKDTAKSTELGKALMDSYLTLSASSTTLDETVTKMSK